MGSTQSTKETIRVNGKCGAWMGKCVMALEKAGFGRIRPDERMFTVDADYRGPTIDGDIRLVLTEEGEKVRIDVRVTADCDNLFAMLTDPRARIMDAFKNHLWHTRRR